MAKVLLFVVLNRLLHIRSSRFYAAVAIARGTNIAEPRVFQLQNISIFNVPLFFFFLGGFGGEGTTSVGKYSKNRHQNTCILLCNFTCSSAKLN
jgi:hypothetical protein